MWNSELRYDIQDMFSDLTVFELTGVEGISFVRPKPKGPNSKSGKGGFKPEGYERRPDRVAYKKAWLASKRDQVNARRRELRVAKRALDLDVVHSAGQECREAHAL